jgi:hypothetical protein
MDHYVRPGALEEVNLPHGIKKELIRVFDGADGGELPEILFVVRRRCRPDGARTCVTVVMTRSPTCDCCAVPVGVRRRLLRTRSSN